MKRLSFKQFDLDFGSARIVLTLVLPFLLTLNQVEGQSQPTTKLPTTGFSTLPPINQPTQFNNQPTTQYASQQPTLNTNQQTVYNTNQPTQNTKQPTVYSTSQQNTLGSSTITSTTERTTKSTEPTTKLTDKPGNTVTSPTVRTTLASNTSPGGQTINPTASATKATINPPNDANTIQATLPTNGKTSSYVSQTAESTTITSPKATTPSSTTPQLTSPTQPHTTWSAGQTTAKTVPTTKKTSNDSPNVANSQDTDFCGQPVVINQYGFCGDPIVNRYPYLTVSPAMEQKVLEAEHQVSLLRSQMQELQNMAEQQMPPRNRDCYDIYKHNNIMVDGVYEIMPDDGKGFEALCLFDDNGEKTDKWTVIQHHINDNVSFNRTWAEFKHGFGVLSPVRSFWLGLEKIYRLTNQKQYTLRIDIDNWGQEIRYAEYKSFRIKSEAEKYAIYYADYSGSANDSLGAYHLNMRFTTVDEDNDLHAQLNCAEAHGGGWWYNACDHANPNGPFQTNRYLQNLQMQNDYGMEWDAWIPNYSFSGFIMRIKPTYDDELL